MRSRLSPAVASSTAAGALVLGLLCGAARAATVDVKLNLPVRARVDLTGRKSVTLAPFMVVSREGERDSRLKNVDIQKEFARYLTKLVKRESDLKVVDSGPVDYPNFDLEVLGKNRDFWRAVGERAQVDVILAGSVDFDVQDRTGYRTEEYVSPFDGRTYYRQVLVEQTGFEYDIVMQVYDGHTGEQLYSDNFKDFKKVEGESADPLQGMFENLSSLEDRIVGIFAQREVEATRTLFTQ